MATSTRFSLRRWLKLLPICILLTVFAVNFITCQDHGHAHDHAYGHSHGNEEPASFKYSKHANEDAKQAVDHGHSHGHAHEHEHSHEGHGNTHEGHVHEEATKRKNARETGLWLWIEALGATAIISVAPVVILLFIPIENALEHQSLLKILLALASGGLLGDAFLHLIPHAMSPHSHGEEGHSHEHAHSHGGEEGHSHTHEMGVGLWVLAGIIAFLIVEKFVRYVKGGHSHSHSIAPVSKDDKKSKDTSGKAKKAKSSDDESEGKKKSDKKEDKKADAAPPQDIKVAGYLNLAADFAHNFTDGLAIGASFIVNRNLGIITMFNIFLHEIPHEVGDFAILVQSGCTKRKAMMLQFSTAIGAMLGTVCSLLAEGVGDAAVAWILPFTAGGFIYIATVSVIPELLEDTKLGQSIKEIIAMLIGVFMMVLIAFFE